MIGREAFVDPARARIVVRSLGLYADRMRVQDNPHRQLKIADLNSALTTALNDEEQEGRMTAPQAGLRTEGRIMNTMTLGQQTREQQETRSSTQRTGQANLSATLPTPFRTPSATVATPVLTLSPNVSIPPFSPPVLPSVPSHLLLHPL